MVLLKLSVLLYQFTHTRKEVVLWFSCRRVPLFKRLCKCGPVDLYQNSVQNFYFEVWSCGPVEIKRPSISVSTD